jgi:glycosyltransferase involved in cell wall biosynthesis
MSIKSLILNTYDRFGGASIAAYRLHNGLQQAGVDSQMMVGYKFSKDNTVIRSSQNLADQALNFFRPALDSLPLTRYPRRQNNTFSFQWFPDGLEHKIASLAPDIINLHWIGSGFVQIETISKFRQPVCWTLHDMWAFTGGCHYSDGCDRFTQSCGACPILCSNQASDITKQVWQRKMTAWEKANLQIITPSRWLADIARSSSLLHNSSIMVIPNGVDTEIYRSVSPELAREQLKLPIDKKLILFGSLNATSDTRKGFDLLIAALALLDDVTKEQVELVIFGADRGRNSPDFGLKTHYLGELKTDRSLALAYGAADVFVLPSRQDNLPNTLLESLACGTPCVSFGIGGIPEAIDHQVNGYIARAFDPQDLATGISWVLDRVEQIEIRQNARQKAEQEYSLIVQASKYKLLYESMLGQLHSIKK